MDENGSGTNSQAPQIGDLLTTLMSNPDAMNMIGGLMKSMSASKPQDDIEAPPIEVSAAPSPPPQEEKEEKEEVQPAGSGGFGGISPDMIKMLPNLMSMLGPMISQNQSKPESPKAEAAETSAKPAGSVPAGGVPAGGVPAGGGGHHHHRNAEHRNRLLFALKPYLSPSRREAVEQIAKVTQITDLLEESGLISVGKDSHDKKSGEFGEVHKT